MKTISLKIFYIKTIRTLMEFWLSVVIRILLFELIWGGILSLDGVNIYIGSIEFKLFYFKRELNKKKFHRTAYIFLDGAALQKWCFSYSPVQVNTYKYKEDCFFVLDEKQITERHMLHIKKKTKYRVLTNSSG